MNDLDPRRATVFGGFAEDYDRWRPAYPDAAVDWLVPPGATRVADVGAGTGKLSGLLAARGLGVFAVEPDRKMLRVLHERYPDVMAFCAPAEELPFPAAAVDAVLVGQAWHWFDHQRALAEARRIIRPGGWLGLISNADQPRTAWQIELARLNPDCPPDHHFDEPGEWEPGGLDGLAVETLLVPWQEEITPEGYRARLATHSAYALLPEPERTERLDAAAAVVARAVADHGTASVPFDQTAFCARVRF